MASKIYIARTHDNRISISYDRDVLPADVTHFHEVTTTADFEKNRNDRSQRFFYLYGQFKVMEYLGFTICIDFGDFFYETGGEVKMPHSSVVPSLA